MSRRHPVAPQADQRNRTDKDMPARPVGSGNRSSGIDA
jgi:hypothetical protein